MTNRNKHRIIKLSYFGIEIKCQNIVRYYKHKSKEWYKEIEYYEGTRKIKQIIDVGIFTFFRNVYGFYLNGDEMVMWLTKKITKYWKNGKVMSIEIVGGEPNTNRSDMLCGKQYYYRENGSREKTLNYHFSKISVLNGCNIMESEGLHGRQLHYHDNNKIASDELYLLGEKHGWQLFYDDKGKLVKKQYFNEGQLLNSIDI